jgi:hypothetical protein
MINDIGRKLIELAVEAGKNLQSEQTGFLYYNHHGEDKQSHDTIPVFENFLYVLALLKTRKGESMQEAKLLLEKLLSYQSNTVEQGRGNFPTYLHEFPFCFSRWNAVKMIAPMYWCYKNFHSILGENLKKKHASSLNNLVSHCLNTLKEDPADYLTALRIGAGAVAVGRLLKEADFEKRGEELIDHLLHTEHPVWFSRYGIAGILTSLQMVYSKISESPWEKFWIHLENMWHPTLNQYCGPAFEEWQRGNLPEQSLYDFYMYVYTHALPPKILEKDISCLYASLIALVDEKIGENPIKDLSGEIENTSWNVKSEEKFALSLITRSRKPDPQIQKGLRSCYVQWKHDDNLYSLSCEGGVYEAMAYEIKDREIYLYFTLPEPLENEHPMENQELTFFCSPSGKIKFNVEGHAATTFKLEETIHIENSPKISVKFKLLDGEGDFLGHLMPGNRPSQKLISKRFTTDAYDRQIFLRTIRKTTSCKIQVKIKWQY